VVEAGTHSWMLNEVTSGVYYLTVTADSWQTTQKLVLNPE
jgi:hypothetical protein